METKNLSLHHLVKEPKIKKEKPPVIIMLHGYGSDANDLFSFAGELPDEYLVISAQAPYKLPPYGNAWYAINFNGSGGKFSDNVQAVESRKKISAFIDEVVEKYPVDKDNITLLGFSQGTILSYAVALSEPDKVKNVVALSGYINEDILKEGYSKNDFSHLSIYSSHGTQDQVIPITWARRNPEILKRLDIDHVYSEFPVGHGVATQNLMEIKNWLAKKI